ncbi:amidohydrolase family protein [Caulobacter segnis]|uniref:amidohydrolase family protein n=1 Tax=Caulobacter segnis TaxID=88688 RepID=UPI00240EA01D|nr:amidohydrolase family protein [Caulobacter segnis]MDG2523033.1 amidohydrolase family protein [Caulobacter segnis]
MIRRKSILAALLVLAAASPAAAETLAIVNARVVSLGAAGDLPRGAVLVRDGKIVDVGASVRIPSDARVIDAAGQTLTPGLVATISPLGLNDTIGSGWPGRGSTDPRLSAGFDVAYDVDPNSPQIPEARVEGVTAAVLAPTPASAAAGAPRKVFGGQLGVIQLSDSGDYLVAPHVAVLTALGEGSTSTAGGGRGAWRGLIKQSLALARDYRAGRVDEGKLEALSLSRADMEALAPIVDRRQPLVVEANRASDIRLALATAREENIRIVISGGAEAWLLAKEIAAAKVPVILDAEDNQAFTFDSLNATYRNAAILNQAGVLVAFKPGIARIVFLIRTPRYLAGRTVPYGLPWEAALAAITVNPARIFGFDGAKGSIAPGKDADLVLWSGDPLETTTVARRVLIGGVEQPMTSRSRQLRDRYIDAVRPAKAAPES